MNDNQIMSNLAEVIRSHDYNRFKEMWDFLFVIVTDEVYAKEKWHNFNNNFGTWLVHLDHTRLTKFEEYVRNFEG